MTWTVSNPNGDVIFTTADPWAARFVWTYMTRNYGGLFTIAAV